MHIHVQGLQRMVWKGENIQYAAVLWAKNALLMLEVRREWAD